jgi:hypothetical protein
MIQMRRAPRWTDQKLRRIEQRSEELAALFDD